MARLRISAQKNLLSGKFRIGRLVLDEETWTTVDADDPEIRAALLAYVSSHIRLAPGEPVDDAGFALAGGKLVDARAAAEKRAAEAEVVEKSAAPLPLAKTKDRRGI